MLTAPARSVPPPWDILVAIRDERVAPVIRLEPLGIGAIGGRATVDVLPQLAPLVRQARGIAVANQPLIVTKGALAPCAPARHRR
jgi:hypothetical protein